MFETSLPTGETLPTLSETLASHGEYHPAAFENLTGHGETLIAGWETLVARAETCFPAGKMSVLTQYRETGTTTWLNGPVCTQMRNIPIPGLTPGKTYDCRIQYVGGLTGYSDWSDVVSHMAT